MANRSNDRKQILKKKTRSGQLSTFRKNAAMMSSRWLFDLPGFRTWTFCSSEKTRKVCQPNLLVKICVGGTSSIFFVFSSGVLTEQKHLGDYFDRKGIVIIQTPTNEDGKELSEDENTELAIEVEAEDVEKTEEGLKVG